MLEGLLRLFSPRPALQVFWYIGQSKPERLVDLAKLAVAQCRVAIVVAAEDQDS